MNDESQTTAGTHAVLRRESSLTVALGPNVHILPGLKLCHALPYLNPINNTLHPVVRVDEMVPRMPFREIITRAVVRWERSISPSNPHVVPLSTSSYYQTLISIRLDTAECHKMTFTQSQRVECWRRWTMLNLALMRVWTTQSVFRDETLFRSKIGLAT